MQHSPFTWGRATSAWPFWNLHKLDEMFFHKNIEKHTSQVLSIILTCITLHMDRCDEICRLAAVPLLVYDIAIRTWFIDRLVGMFQCVAMVQAHSCQLMDIPLTDIINNYPSQV